MTADMRSVYSSMVNTIGWDPDTGDLIVTWARGGKTSRYSGVPEAVAVSVMNSASVGSAINEQIKGVYPHAYI